MPTDRVDLHIRELTPRDLAQYRAIRRRALEVSPEAFGTLLAEFEMESADAQRLRLEQDWRSPNALLLGAFCDGAIVGMAGFVRFGRRKRYHRGLLWGVFVDPAYRRQGIGRELVEHLLAFARALPGLEAVILSVVASNASAVRLYEALGFRTYSREPRAFKDPSGVYYDELHMRLDLVEGA